MEKKEAYPACDVLFKTDATPGWNTAFVTGTKEEAAEKIKKYQWQETKIFDCYKFYFPVHDIVPCNLDFKEIHQLSDWVYCKELNKWFLDDEIIPVPAANANDSTFNYEISYDDEFFNKELDELYEEEVELYDDPYFQCVADMTINGFQFQWVFSDWYFKEFSNLFRELKEKDFAYAQLQEYDYLKFIVWDLGKNIRFIIQDYNRNDKLFEPVDICMNKEKFFIQFKGMLNTLQKDLDAYKVKFNKATDTVGKINY